MLHVVKADWVKRISQNQFPGFLFWKPLPETNFPGQVRFSPETSILGGLLHNPRTLQRPPQTFKQAKATESSSRTTHVPCCRFLLCQAGCNASGSFYNESRICDGNRRTRQVSNSIFIWAPQLFQLWPCGVFQVFSISSRSCRFSW